MEIGTLLFLIIIVCLGAFVHGITGFGVGIFLMLFLPYVFSYQMSVGIVTICAVVMSSVLLFNTRKNVEMKKILPVLIPTAIIQIISTYFLFALDDSALTIILVIILLLFAGLFVLSDIRWQIKASVPNGILAGCITGACNILGIGGPPIGYYYHSIFKDNISYLANTQVTILTMCALLLIQHIIKGNITLVTLEYSIISSIVCIAVLLPTLKAFKKLDRSKLTKIIILFLIVMAIIKLAF